MNYFEWNDLLAQNFFGPDKAGREVLLYVNEDLIQKLGAPSGQGPQDFVDSIKAECHPREICNLALTLAEGWRSKPYRFPPYIGILGLFVLSDVTEGDFVGHAYYPRLWARLGEPDMQKEPSHFDRMIEIWDDLEKWTREDLGEEQGKFVARIRGGRWKVGLPRSQTLLSEAEREELPGLFNEAGLEPGTRTSPEALLASILSCRQATLIKFYQRTTNLLRARTADPELRDALLALLAEELEAWDGSSGSTDEETRPRQVLKIVIEEVGGPFAGPLKARVRISARMPYPDERLTFVCRGRSWTCSEELNGWSTPLESLDSASPAFLEPDEEMWAGQAKMMDQNLAWGARQVQRRFRIFYRDSFGIPLPGWIEAARLEPSREMLLVAAPDLVPSIQSWGPAACKNFRRVETTGLPAGWQVFSSESVQASHPGLPLLTVSKRLGLKLAGGIKPGRGNTYLSFAHPHILAEEVSGASATQVWLEGRELRPIPGGKGVWALPPNLPSGRAYKVTAKAGTQDASVLFKLVDPEIADLGQCAFRAPTGTATAEAGVRIRGAVIADAPDFPALPASTRQQMFDCLEGAVFLGRSPGQIRAPGNPAGWQPVWAVVSRPHGRFEALFCGSEISQDVLPVVTASAGRLAAEWKERLWTNRKKTDSPSHPELQRLWTAYLKVARDV